jgi:glycosyltransferase involved in cell wall biosynthesis
MKILYFGESPCVSTGAGNVSRHILSFMKEMGHDIEVAAINHYGIEHDEQLYPYKIHASPVDDLSNFKKMKELLWQGDYDAIFLYADVSPISEFHEAIREAKQQKSTPLIIYSCLDADDFNWETAAILTIADYITVYSEHSRKAIQKYTPALKVETICHGCEPDVFFPLSPEQRKQVRKDTFGIEDDETFIVLNVNRNQWRKDLGRTIMIFHEFHKSHPNSFLAMHSKANDVGGSLPCMAKIIGIRTEGPKREIAFPPPSFHEVIGVPREALNSIYNAADVLVSTTTGEGWGLTTTEAMTAQCPVIVPRNSSCVEIVGEHEERGYLADSGGDIDHMYIPYGNSSNPRPIVHAKSMLEKLGHVYSNRDEARAKAALARQWALSNTWSGKIKQQWQALFAEIGSKIEAKGEVSV